MIMVSLALNQTDWLGIKALQPLNARFRNLHAHDWLSIKALQRHNAILTSMMICLEMLSSWF